MKNKMLGLLGSWHKNEQISNPSLWGEPVFGSIHGSQAISTTHNCYDDARGSSRPSSPPDRRQTGPPLVSPVSTQSPPGTQMCTRSSQIRIHLVFIIVHKQTQFQAALTFVCSSSGKKIKNILL